MLETHESAAAFAETLRREGRYRTPLGHKRSWIGRFDASFYARLLQIFVSGMNFSKIGRFDQKEWYRHSFSILRLSEDCGADISIEGYHHALSGRPQVYVSNHMSMLESYLLPAILIPLDFVTTVIKKEMLEYPIIKHFMTAVQPIAVGRANPREDLQLVLEEGRRELTSGRSVLLFPQSTRSSEFRPEKFNSLGFKLAKSAAVPLVPIAVKTDFLPNGRWIKDIGALDRSKPVKIEFAAPLDPAASGKAAHEACIAFISERTSAWK